MEQKAGVYIIRCLATGQVYVGVGIVVLERLANNRVALRGGTVHNRRLQSMWDRLGESAFSFEVAEIVSDPALVARAEAAWIERLHARDPVRGFNVSSAYSGHPVPIIGRRTPDDDTVAGKAHVVKKAILNRLRELRQEHGLTQEQLAADLEVTRHTILALEAGRYVPSIELALRLAAYFDRPLETIFRLDPEEDRALRGLAPSPAPNRVESGSESEV